MIGLPIQRELAFRDAIGIASNDGAEIGTYGLVIVQRPAPQHQIVEMALAIGRVDLGDDAAVVQELDSERVVVAEA
jgi:hypothetical protein